MRRIQQLAAIACLLAGAAQGAAAQTSIGLQNYVLTSNHALEALGGRGLEASAVTYARDRGTLFFVGDEGLGVVEITRGGQTVGSMAFSGWPPASGNHDAEGLAYLGNGVLVVAEERLQDALRFNYSAGGNVDLGSVPFVSIGANTGNTGIEGIALDPRNGAFFSVKQSGPQNVLAGNLSFAGTPGGGTSSMLPLFNPALLGLASLSDVASLGGVDALAGAPAGDNLLILSLDSRRVVETNRQGQVLSSLDLAGLTPQAIEGLTIDESGTLYLVAESSDALPSRLFVLSPVPEPATTALMAVGLLGLVGLRLRSRRGR